MSAGQGPNGRRDDSALSVEELAARVDKLRKDGHRPRDLVDAITEYALKQIYNPKLVMSLATEVKELSEGIGYVGGVGWGLGLMGIGLYMVSRNAEALECLKEAERLAGDFEDKRMRLGLTAGYASIYLSLGDFEQALEYGVKALQLARSLESPNEEAWLHQGMSTAYADLGDFDRAYDHARMGLDLFNDLYAETNDREHRIGIARCLSAKGSALQARGDVDAATPIQVEALTIFRQAENEMGVARALNDLGLIAFENHDYERAEAYHRESLAIREKINSPQSQSTSLLNLARVQLATGRPEEALSSLEDAQALAGESGARVRIYQTHGVLADVYEKLGDISRALKHHRLFHQLREEVVGEAVAARIKNLQIAFEIERSEREAELIRRKNDELSETNNRLNRLLEELQRAQDRLVQAEKMASLGQLTAGIAHEIKNPLNFITNFAAMNVELVNELGEAVSSQTEDELDEEEIADLVSDIVENSRRVLEHGQRADSIIRSMLQHARGGGGEIGPVRFNAFVDEYIKLAYHGFRAQHADFNVTMDLTYDPAIETVDVASGDIGRVILNLANNAFFALEELRINGILDFEPTLNVSTALRERFVDLRVRDNGPGIPDSIKSRIFEPFFTTKAAGEGTGLGLSLSYDIVVQGHGGEMYVESEEGSYTEFVVTIPVSNVHVS